MFRLFLVALGLGGFAGTLVGLGLDGSAGLLPLLGLGGSLALGGAVVGLGWSIVVRQ